MQSVAEAVPDGSPVVVSYDELLLPGAATLPINAEEMFGRSVRNRFDVATAFDGLGGYNGSVAQERAKADLRDGVALHVTYSGKRYRVDMLNEGRSIVQDCATEEQYQLDRELHSVRKQQINRIANAYAAGANLRVTPNADVPLAGAATTVGTVTPAAYSLTNTLAATGGYLKPGTYENSFAFSYGDVVPLPACPFATLSELLSGAFGPASAVVVDRSYLTGMNVNVAENNAVFPITLPTAVVYTRQFPALDRGIVQRFHISLRADEKVLAIPPN